MPIIHVELVEGRTKEQKKQLGEAITKAAVDIVNVPADAVKVIFVDMKKMIIWKAAFCGLNAKATTDRLVHRD